jgi:hypothetical protein
MIMYLFVIGGVNENMEVTVVVNMKEDKREFRILKDHQPICHIIDNLPDDGVFLGVCFYEQSTNCCFVRFHVPSKMK